MKKHSYLAFLIIFVISLIHLHPYFFGKIDIPLDLRDLRMYPWKYYAVDKKIKKTILWENHFDNLFSLTVPPKNINSLKYKLNFRNNDFDKNNTQDYNFYILLDFKFQNEKIPADFGISLKDRSSGEVYNPGAIIDSLNNDSKWNEANFHLNQLIKNIKDPKKLQDYDLSIVLNNKSEIESTIVFLKSIRLLCEDYSNVQRVHNHYLHDIIQMFPHIREYFSISLKEGRLPFWNNYILTGVEFLAEPQVGFFHPVYFLTYFLFNQFTAHAIMSFLSLFFCGIGAYLLSRFWGFSFYSSLLVGIIYMFQPFNATWMSYEHMLMNSATLPFLLLFYEKNIKAEKLLNKHLLISALLLGLIFLSGHLQYIHYTAIFFILFSVYKFIACALNVNLRSVFVKHSFSIVFVFGIAVMIGAIVLVPFMSLLGNSHRVPNSIGFIKSTSIPLSALYGLLNPFYKGVPDWTLSGYMDISEAYDKYRNGFSRNYIYFGLLPFLLLFFSFKKIYEKDKLSIFLFLTILISFLIAMGSPLFFLIKDIIPGFSTMQHYRFILLYSFAVPFLCGIGFQELCNLFPKFNNRKILLLIIIISAIDLMYFSSYFLTWSNRKDYKPIEKGGSLEFLINKQKDSLEPFRVLPITVEDIKGCDIAKPNTLQSYMIEDASGYSSFVNKDIYYGYVYIQTKDPARLYSGKIFDLFPNINVPYPISNYQSKILDLLNVKYFLVPNQLELKTNDVTKVYKGDISIYENKGYLPRAFFVPNYKIIDSKKETIIYLDSEEFDPRKEVVLMIAPRVIALSPTAPRNDIQFVKYKPENITLKVNIDKPGFLVLGHNLNNNWKVKINSKDGEHIQANLIQRAVYLPNGGEYIVEFYYYPKLFFIGLFVTLTGLLILIILGIFLSLKQENKK